MKTELEFIFTYDEAPQEFVNEVVNEMALNNILLNEKSLFEFATKELTEDKKRTLIKISCCVYSDGGYVPPQWYMDCNGKLWPENGIIE